MTCTADGCDKEAAARGLCWGHYRQQARGKRLTPLKPLQGGKTKARAHESAKAMTVEAMLAFAEAAEDSAFDRAWHRARMAWFRYFRRRQNRGQSAPKNTPEADGK